MAEYSEEKDWRVGADPLPTNFDRDELLKRDFVNLTEFQHLTGLSTTHIRDHLIKKGIIEAAKLGGVWVIPTDQLAVLREHVRSESQKRRDNPE